MYNNNDPMNNMGMGTYPMYHMGMYPMYQMYQMGCMQPGNEEMDPVQMQLMQMNMLLQNMYMTLHRTHMEVMQLKEKIECE
ncbi:hypothetical protein SAMN00017405_2043 [Desulfonispora thiosulfatigenes DSM 11270]|uniref:Uncharacterized protein n=1 Tax=Desulfonispora thiosulfatigenes DSM 11270 TaxID=656914 RepID=A0A1W1UJI7_DESTI|nr:hypothetical protein [Desulfonispora thiosulfatigenes]SMB81183.1 hypothetical protein SAMN00017405_2043 [Desulfonispora thiosulfatigenes DSM 11270]